MSIWRLYDYTMQRLLSSMLTSCHAIRGEQWWLGPGGTNTHTLRPWAVLGQEQSWLCAVWSVAVRVVCYQIRSCGNIL